VAIHNLMEDAATAEISRSQVWQWIHNAVELDDGTTVSATLVREETEAQLARVRDELGVAAWAASRFATAGELFLRLVLDDGFEQFLTLPAYDLID
jgi:malate synthase